MLNVTKEKCLSLQDSVYGASVLWERLIYARTYKTHLKKVKNLNFTPEPYLYIVFKFLLHYVAQVKNHVIIASITDQHTTVFFL